MLLFAYRKLFQFDVSLNEKICPLDFVKEKQKIAMNSWETWHIDFFGSSAFQGEKEILYVSDQISYPKNIIILFLQYYFKHF